MEDNMYTTDTLPMFPNLRGLIVINCLFLFLKPKNPGGLNFQVHILRSIRMLLTKNPNITNAQN